jgi:hypothetical protein
MSEEVWVSGDGVFEMESLIREVNRIIIEAKFTVNINSTAVQKVVNVTDDQGALENVADQLTVLGEGRADRGTERVNKIPKWGVGGGSGVADAGAKVKGWDVEDSSLELVSGRDDSGVGGVSLERRDRRKDRRRFQEGQREKGDLGKMRPGLH